MPEDFCSRLSGASRADVIRVRTAAEGHRRRVRCDENKKKRVTLFPTPLLRVCRRARFKRSNSVTASVQADLDPEGFPGLSIAVPTQDKSLQFGCSFQRHSSEPESASQYTECHRTVHTQGQWAYREVGGNPEEACRLLPKMSKKYIFLKLASIKGFEYKYKRSTRESRGKKKKNNNF